VLLSSCTRLTFSDDEIGGISGLDKLVNQYCTGGIKSLTVRTRSFSELIASLSATWACVITSPSSLPDVRRGLDASRLIVAQICASWIRSTYGSAARPSRAARSPT